MHPNDVDRKRIERALAARVRYRYVSPEVQADEAGYRIQSPCCSRNVDKAGGTIDIWPLYLFHPGAQTLNVAISLRAHAVIERRPDERIELVSEDTDRLVNLSADQLHADNTLPLVAKLAHRFGARGLRLTTRGESPAGAGIAGSSALNVAVCGVAIHPDLNVVTPGIRSRRSVTVKAPVANSWARFH